VYFGDKLEKKSKLDKIPENLMRKGRKDPSGWVVFIPISEDEVLY
jgi:hypothetical protein